MLSTMDGYGVLEQSDVVSVVGEHTSLVTPTALGGDNDASVSVSAPHQVHLWWPVALSLSLAFALVVWLLSSLPVGEFELTFGVHHTVPDVKPAPPPLAPPPASTTPFPSSTTVWPTVYQSESRGYVAVLYSGSLRAFADTFASQIINVFAPSPYAVHVYMHVSVLWKEHKSDDDEHRALDATLDFYSGYYNIDNQYVPLSQAIKWLSVEVESLSTSVPYLEVAHVIGNHSMSNVNKVLSALESLRKANEARLSYQQQHGIEYQYVVRLRYDQIIRTNLWSHLFNISFADSNSENDAISSISNSSSIGSSSINNLVNFNGLWVPDGRSTYTLYEFKYRSVNRADLPTLPSCEWHRGGWSDQFFLSNSTIFNYYANRSINLALVQSLLSDSEWRFHAENYVKNTMNYYGFVLPQILPMCYSVLRAEPRQLPRVNLPFGHNCKTAYGLGCCMTMCAEYVAWQDALRRRVLPNGAKQAQLDSYIAQTSTTLNINSSSFWYFHVLSNPYLAYPCELSTWEDFTSDPYHFHKQKLPFLVTNGMKQAQMEDQLACARA